MPKITCTRPMPASPERVWEVVGDPEHMPRWWPGVRRMEGVDAERFTQVHMTSKGRGVRVDFSILESEPPEAGQPALHRFQQEVIGTPFERVLRSALTEIQIREDGAGGSEVRILSVQKLRGTSRFGGFLLRRATRARLEEALEGLERLV